MLPTLMKVVLVWGSKKLVSVSVAPLSDVRPRFVGCTVCGLSAENSDSTAPAAADA
jgi:hypothetical protein